MPLFGRTVCACYQIPFLLFSFETDCAQPLPETVSAGALAASTLRSPTLTSQSCLHGDLLQTLDILLGPINFRVPYSVPPDPSCHLVLSLCALPWWPHPSVKPKHSLYPDDSHICTFSLGLSPERHCLIANCHLTAVLGDAAGVPDGVLDLPPSCSPYSLPIWSFLLLMPEILVFLVAHT